MMAVETIADRIKSYINTNPGKTTIYIFSLIFAVIGIGSILLPEIVWDQFVWRYFWGPLAADAEDRTIGDISEGYNIISTLSYGIVLAAAILVIYRLIVILDIRMDRWFFLAVIPYILFGGFSRALEDAMFFNSPTVYLFISPVIYVLTGLVSVLLMVIAHFLSKLNFKKKKSGKQAQKMFFTWLIIIFVVINIFMALVYFKPDRTNYSISSIMPFATTVIIFLVIMMYSKNKRLAGIPTALTFGAFGLIMLSYPAVAVAGWFTSPDEWVQLVRDANFGDEIVLRPAALGVVIGLAMLATAIWAGVAYTVARTEKFKKYVLFYSGVNLALVFGQFTDAAATFIAIDYYSYWEKHVLPGLLIDVLDTAAVMFLLKVIALLFTIYVLDFALKDELKNHRKIVPLIKIAVMVLGLAPGTRDMLRLAMGV